MWVAMEKKIRQQKIGSWTREYKRRLKVKVLSDWKIACISWIIGEEERKDTKKAKDETGYR